tara:strand:+ start:364 stop:783 length:420 start_codon:yes stop_codon:yes gene_type:complete
MSKASDLARLMTSGSTAIHGEAGVTASGSTGLTTNLQQGLAKGWMNFDQDTPTIDDSLNISSVNDDSTGTFSPSYTNSFNNVNYACSGITNTTIFVCLEDNNNETTETTTSDTKMQAMQHNGTLFDCEQTMVIWHGDLA